MADTAVIIIGRNEGERLRRAIASIPQNEGHSLYVDSGSTDGSIEIARSLVAVHQLNPSTPFSAARARAEGVEVLAREYARVDYIQFLDGDCELASEWLRQAAAYLDQHEDVAIVCGQLSEAQSDVLLYRKLSPQTWKQPAGDVEACGGIFMIRALAYEAVGGFNRSLLTREESDLCARIRAAGGRVVRLDLPMACHDSGIDTFSQWWARAVWGGYGDALSIRNSRANRRRLRRMWTALLLPPTLLVIGCFGMIWSLWFAAAIVCGLAGIGVQFTRTAVARWRQGDSVSYALQFSAFSSLRVIAGGVGFLRYYTQRGATAKRPDPRPGLDATVIDAVSEHDRCAADAV
ncbi:MAG: glycosyltransferase family 2 protein [Phycisphaerales bacterium]|nr:glycosyltransferase family 2 protein [Phycisphaerales bacterium]